MYYCGQTENWASILEKTASFVFLFYNICSQCLSSPHFPGPAKLLVLSLNKRELAIIIIIQSAEEINHLAQYLSIHTFTYLFMEDKILIVNLN